MSFNESEEVNITQPLDLDAMRADMEAGTPGPWSVKHKETWPFSISLEPSILVMDRIAYSTAHKCLEDVRRAEGFENQDDVARMVAQQEANARLIASCPDMAAEILRLTAENERLRKRTSDDKQEIADMSRDRTDFRKAYLTEVKRLTVENARLREGGTYAEGYADALEAAAKVCTEGSERPQKIPPAQLRKMSTPEQWAHECLMLAWKDADEILALTIKEKPDE